MKQVLVVYYTQTGQLKRAVKSTLAAFESDPNVQVDTLEVKPVTPFPYPWSYMQFFDAFPETVRGVACPLQPFGIDPNKQFDLVVIAYQPWFLSISIPINSFLQSKEAEQLLKGKPVVTLIACRNMWLGSQEKMKVHLRRLEATLVGNITFVDPAANLVSLVTVFAFALGGVKDKFLGIFPKYGVSDQELESKAPVFGSILHKHLMTGNYEDQQEELIREGAIKIKSNLMLLEGRGRALFPLYANYISKKGTAGSDERRTRVRIFGIVLPTAILILSPIITIISRLAPLIFAKKFRKQIDYYSRNELKN